MYIRIIGTIGLCFLSTAAIAQTPLLDPGPPPLAPAPRIQEPLPSEAYQRLYEDTTLPRDPKGSWKPDHELQISPPRSRHKTVTPPPHPKPVHPEALRSLPDNAQPEKEKAKEQEHMPAGTP